jgi:hypothetical protein
LNPLVVFTADQDWAPEWTCTNFVHDLARFDLQCHLFRTSESPSLDQAFSEKLITQGWHPNFMMNSTHGDSITEVIETMKLLVPESRTVRAHSYFESSETWKHLFEANQVVESHGPTIRSEGLMPIQLASNMIRIPVFFEDDVLLRDDPIALKSIDLLRKIVTPGLKVFDFHPVHLGINSRSLEHYNSSRPHLQDENFFKESRNSRGVRTLFIEVIDFIRCHKIEMMDFETLVDTLLNKDS